MLSARIAFYSLLALLAVACSNDQVGTNHPGDVEESMFDSPATISINLNEIDADEWGMRQYVIAFLKIGPNRDQDSAAAAQLQTAHRNNIKRMAKEGSLLLAGPFLDGGELAGIYVFDVTTIGEAEGLTATDPAIAAGRLTMEMHPWYGSAALLKVNAIHNLIAPPE